MLRLLYRFQVQFKRSHTVPSPGGERNSPRICAGAPKIGPEVSIAASESKTDDYLPAKRHNWEVSYIVSTCSVYLIMDN